MINFLKLYSGILVSWIFLFKSNSLLFKVNIKVNIRIILAVIIGALLTCMLNVFNLASLSGIIKVVISYSFFCVFNRIILCKDWQKVIIGSLIYYLCLAVSEVTVAIVASLFLTAIGQSVELLQNTTAINFLISFVTYMVISKWRNSLNLFVENSNKSKIGTVIIYVIILITISLLIFRMPVSKWDFNIEFVLTMSTLLCFCIVGLYILKQRSDIQRTTSMYQQVVKYSNTTNKLLEDYRVISHEHKNQLSIIRQMANKEDVELIEYIDGLLDKRNIIKYRWVTELNKIPLDGLKGLFNYKLLEAEENKINLFINISSELSKSKNYLKRLSTSQKDDLYSIVGVYLDNAIQASKECKKREMSIEIYKDNKDIVLVFGNTFKNKINVDRLDDYGYSTKGKNHGIGLHIVKTIMAESTIFTQKRNIVDNYYIQELRINLSSIKK